MSDPKQPFGAGISPKSAALDDLERQSAAEGTTGGLSASGSQSEQRQGEQAQGECEPLEGGERGGEQAGVQSKGSTQKKKLDGRRFNGERIRKYQWKPGQSGNPSGRPKGTICLTNRIRGKLRRNPEMANAVCQSVIDSAIDGDMRAAQLLMDRVDGLLTKKVQVETAHRKVLGFRDPLQGTELEQPEEPRTLDLTQGEE